MAFGWDSSEFRGCRVGVKVKGLVWASFFLCAGRLADTHPRKGGQAVVNVKDESVKKVLQKQPKRPARHKQHSHGESREARSGGGER